MKKLQCLQYWAYKKWQLLISINQSANHMDPFTKEIKSKLVMYSGGFKLQAKNTYIKWTTWLNNIQRNPKMQGGWGWEGVCPSYPYCTLTVKIVRFFFQNILISVKGRWWFEGGLFLCLLIYPMRNFILLHYVWILVKALVGGEGRGGEGPWTRRWGWKWLDRFPPHLQHICSITKELLKNLLLRTLFL